MKIKYQRYVDETRLTEMIDLFSAHLSEPYNVYTYRIFVASFADLAFIATDEDDRIVGAICSKIDTKNNEKVGYIGMVAVDPSVRGNGIGRHLCELSMDAMKKHDIQYVTLETETSNSTSLDFYDRLGFVRCKHLRNYYLTANSAYRLKKYV